MMYSEYPLQERVTSVMYRVYGWMAIALAVTAGIAYYLLGAVGLFKAIYSNSLYFGGILVLQIALVLVISLMIEKIKFVTAFALFMLYAASVGVTMSVFLYVYTPESVYLTFLITAGMFASMAIYGYVTNSDLSSIGSIGMMALFGMIIAGLVNFFLKSPAVAYGISLVGVFVFTLLTAYDVQKIKLIAMRLLGDQETMNKVALLGALTLYLDFINLFISLLNLMGKKRDE